MPDDVTTQPTPAPAAPDTTAAPASVGSAPPVADVTSTPTPNPAAVQAQIAPIQQEQNTIASQIKGLAQPAAPTPPPPHARLLAMVSGLALGLDAFGKSIATQGKEGGATEVQQVRGEQQRQQIEKQQAAQAQKNAQIQQLMTVYDTNQKQMQSIVNLATLPNQITESDLKVKSEEQGLEAGKVSLALDKFNLFANTGLSPDGIDQLVKGGTVDAGTSGVLRANAQQQYHLSSQPNVLPPNDPYLDALKTALDDPNTPASTLVLASKRLQDEVVGQQKATAAKTAAEAAAANSPVGKLSTPEVLAAPGAQAAIQAKIADPTTDPADIPRLKALIPRAALAQKNALILEAAKERNQEAITNGDPKAAGALLYSGLVSPKELISNRQPAFAQGAFDEAMRLGGGTKGPDGKWSGSSWSAVKAEAQYEYAENPKTQNTLNLLSTMRAPGGSIDIAKNAFNAIPGKIDSTTFNKIMNGTITQFGGKSVTDFKAAMTSLADEYAQVLQGGAATETTLGQARDLIQQAYTKSQGAGAFDIIGQDMAARQRGMIRDNPTLMQIYPENSATTPIFQPDATQPARPVNVPANQIHGNGPHGMGWYDPAIFGGK